MTSLEAIYVQTTQDLEESQCLLSNTKAAKVFDGGLKPTEQLFGTNSVKLTVIALFIFFNNSNLLSSKWMILSFHTFVFILFLLIKNGLLLERILERR